MKIKKAVRIEADQIYSVHQMADNFKCSYWSIKKWLELREIPMERIGGTLWVSGAQIIRQTSIAPLIYPSKEKL